jgi:hypothetical protein
MSSILVTISMAILSFLSFKGLKPARVKIRAHAPMRSSKFMQALLPFVFALALFSAAPAPAQAAPAPAGEGTFDCLGSFDWGCNVIGYLFEGKGLATFTTGGNDDGRTRATDSTSVQNALMKMMAFFSNAMLIIASLMLLYHFIVMVAETAHTGTIGGKETNQLWAPIRLVIAIGLLVPLSTSGAMSGLNSGQYIILQIAKWGAGLGSQAWKTFTKELAENQTLVPSLTPAVQGLVSNTLKIYACQAAANYIATGARRPANEAKEPEPVEGRGSARTETFKFSNGITDGFCGQIIVTYPERGKDRSAISQADQLSTANSTAFENFRPMLKREAERLINEYFVPNIPPDRRLESRVVLNQLIAQFQNQIIQQTNSISDRVASNTYKEITESIKRASDSYGWMSAGTWFMAISRAQGQIISAGMLIPNASPPDEALFANDNSDGAKIYKEFLLWAKHSPSLRPTAGTQPLASRDDVGRPMPVGIPNAIPNTINSSVRPIVQWFYPEFGSYIDSFAAFLKSNPREAATTILQVINAVAAQHDVWQSNGAWDEVGTRGMTINNTNPMADLTHLGHSHVQLAIDLWGMALIYATAGVGLDLTARAVSLGFLGNWSNIFAVMGLTAAAFLTVFSAFAFIAGIVLTFLVPLMPFVRFFYAIVTWVGAILEAMFCLPFLAIAHLNPKGEGFTGAKPQFGYRMIFQIFLRPTLTIFGLIGSLLLFYVAVRFLNAMYYQTVLGLANFGSGPAAFVARVVFSIFYITLIYISATMSFKMIDHIPQRALQWMGDGAQEVHYQDDQGTLSAVSSQTHSQITGDVLRAPDNLGNKLRLR